MSRPIKFRAWVEEEKWDYYVYDIQKRADMAEWFGNSTIHIEQYTGLKDKNGKEIYEGDILNTCCGKAKVYFDEEDCSYKLWLKHGTTMPLVGKKSHRHLVYEVLGNIHENKELLGGEE